MSVVAARNVGCEDVADEGLSHIYGTQTALKELLEANPAEYLGAGHAAGEKCDLGVLVKIIDSSERLRYRRTLTSRRRERSSQARTARRNAGTSSAGAK